VNNMKKPQPQQQQGRKTFVTSFIKALKSFSTSLPMLFGVLLLVGLFQTFISSEMLAAVFNGEPFRDTLIGTLIGSISAGNPLTSYIIGGGLLEKGVSFFAVTAFLVAWVTVGLIQYPAEVEAFGKRFATLRNLLSFMLAVVVSLLTVATLGIF